MIDEERLAEVQRLPIEVVARELAGALGNRLTAAIGAVRHAALVEEWSTGKSRPLREDALRAALQATRAIVDAEGDAVAQAWWLGTNRHLESRSPLEVIREDSAVALKSVLAAAITFAMQ